MGNKGADLCELSRLKLPVPSGFILTTEACNQYFHAVVNAPESKSETYTSPSAFIPSEIMDECIRHVHDLERASGRVFAKPSGTPAAGNGGKTSAKASTTHITQAVYPLLLSVRASCPISCGGLSETILNLGMNDEVVATLSQLTNNTKFALDTYVRFLHMYGTIVMGIPDSNYESLLTNKRISTGATTNNDFSSSDLQSLVREFKKLAEPPQDPYVQLQEAIASIFNSWHSVKATSYRELHHLSKEHGTAVIVQMMVFGNMNSKSGTGVLSTRCPSTGEKKFRGEFLAAAEGEDVLRGRGQRMAVSLDEMRVAMPVVYDTLAQLETSLERHYKDMLVSEFKYISMIISMSMAMSIDMFT